MMKFFDKTTKETYLFIEFSYFAQVNRSKNVDHISAKENEKCISMEEVNNQCKKINQEIAEKLSRWSSDVTYSFSIKFEGVLNGEPVEIQKTFTTIEDYQGLFKDNSLHNPQPQLQLN